MAVVVPLGKDGTKLISDICVFGCENVPHALPQALRREPVAADGDLWIGAQLLHIEYYCKLPKDKDAFTIVVDPMLATGGSSSAAITQLKARGLKNICFIMTITQLYMTCILFLMKH